MTPDVVSLVVLPPLLYAASEELPWRDLLAVWRPVLVLAVGLVLASAAAVGAVAGVVAGIPASMAFVLGAVLASTDEHRRRRGLSWGPGSIAAGPGRSRHADVRDQRADPVA